MFDKGGYIDLRQEFDKVFWNLDAVFTHVFSVLFCKEQLNLIIGKSGATVVYVSFTFRTF